MNNIQKAFKNKAKRGLHMAFGGVTPGYTSSIPDMMGSRAPGVANTAAPVSPMMPGQRMAPMSNNLPSGGGTAPVSPGLGAPPARQLSSQMGRDIALDTAVAGLSNTDRYHMENPNNAKYGVSGPAPGSSAEASQLGQQLDIKKQLMASVQAQGMAAGGVAETPDQLMARMAEKYGGAPSPAAAPAPVAQAPAPVAQAPAPASKGLFSNFSGLVQKRKQAADAVGMADGGVANHMVHGDGPKGVDSVPATLAPGEGVIPAKMVDGYFGGPAKLENLIESFTGEPTATRHGLRGQLHAANGTGGEYPARDFEVPNPAALAAVQPQATPVVFKKPVDAPVAEPVAEPSVPGSVRSYPNNYGNIRAANIPAAAPAVAAPVAAPDMIAPIADAPSAAAAPAPTSAPRRSIAGWVDKAKNMAGYGPENASAPAKLAPKLSAKLNALTQDESFLGKAGRAAEAVAGKAKAIAPAAASLEALGTAGAALGMAAPTLQNTLGDDRIKVDKDNNTGAWDRAGKSLKEGAMNSIDVAGKVADSLASPISTGLNYANGKLGGNPNYFNEHNASDSIRSGLAGDGVTAPLSQVTAAKETAQRETARRGAAPSATPVTSAGADRAIAGPTAQATVAAAPDAAFTKSADQTRSIRNGFISNQPNDPTFQRGTSTVDATAMQAPEGGGYITKPGGGKAIFVPGQAAPARDPNKTYDADGNDMTRTNGMKAQLAEMQKARFLSEATATNGAYHEGGKTGLAAMQMQDQTALGQGKLAVEDKLAQGQLAHYKQLEAQYGQQRALAMYQMQLGQWEQSGKNWESYADNLFPSADGKTPNPERQKLEVALHSAMASNGLFHKGQLNSAQQQNLAGLFQNGRDQEKNNEALSKRVAEFLRGNELTTGGDYSQQRGGPIQNGLFGQWQNVPGKGHQYVRDTVGGGIGSPVDAQRKQLLTHNQ